MDLVLQEYEKERVPFETIEEVEALYCRMIYSIEHGWLTIVGCYKNKEHNDINIICSNENEKEFNLTSSEWLKISTLDGHPFGKLKK